MKILEIKNGVYGTYSETYLVVGDYVGCIDSVDSLESSTFFWSSKEDLMEKEDLEYCGEDLSFDLEKAWKEKITAFYVAIIEKELNRLQLDTEVDVCSGLMIDVFNVYRENDEDLAELLEDCLPIPVKVYDDYESIWVCPWDLIMSLIDLEPEDVSLDSQSVNNIWQYLPEEY